MESSANPLHFNIQHGYTEKNSKQLQEPPRQIPTKVEWFFEWKTSFPDKKKPPKAVSDSKLFAENGPIMS